MTHSKGNIKNILTNEKTCGLFIELSKGASYTLKIARKLNVTPTHVFGNIHKFEESGLADIKKIGRYKLVSLTDKGKEIAKSLIDMYFILNPSSRTSASSRT